VLLLVLLLLLLRLLVEGTRAGLWLGLLAVLLLPLAGRGPADGLA